MGSLNKVILIGHLGRDAELRFTAKGFPIARVNLATSDRRKDQHDQWHAHTVWHRVTLLGSQALGLQPYLTKGKQIFVEGRLDIRQWDQDGETRSAVEIVARTIRLLGPGPGNRLLDPAQTEDAVFDTVDLELPPEVDDDMPL